MRTVGLFQDGGLTNNCPSAISQWEAEFIWPDKADPDFALSLGTGAVAESSHCRPSWLRSRFCSRVFRSFIQNIDAEEAYKRFFNSLPPHMRQRYHRLNIQFAGAEPSLDDALQIPELKSSVLRTIKDGDPTLTAVTDSILASMFYFELDGMPKVQKDGYTCSGFILCRVDLPLDGRRYLYNHLLETSSWFLVQGSPICSVESVPRSLPPFKRRVIFYVSSLDSIITFSVRGITSASRMLSGFHTSLEKLVTQQRLDSPFGTIDHITTERPLPAVPSKRCSIVRAVQRKEVAKRSRKRM